MTAEDMVAHVESGTCPSGNTRQTVDTVLLSLDRNHAITRSLYGAPACFARLYAAENYYYEFGYRCPLCATEHTTERELDDHLVGPKHNQALYRCPVQSCNMSHGTLSSLVGHWEKNSCGFGKGQLVVENARYGLEPLIVSMIHG